MCSKLFPTYSRNKIETHLSATILERIRLFNHKIYIQKDEIIIGLIYGNNYKFDFWYNYIR